MPIYEYRCTTCERHLEQNQSFSDEPLTTCPTCGGTLRKVFGSVGIVLKGSGFYRTDSRTSPTRTAAAKDNGTSTSSSDGSSSSEGSSSSSEGSSPGGTPAPKSEPSSNGSSSTPSPASTGSSASTGSTAGSS